MSRGGGFKSEYVWDGAGALYREGWALDEIKAPYRGGLRPCTVGQSTPPPRERTDTTETLPSRNFVGGR